MPFASGKYSIAFCDRCGMKYPYNSLRPEVVNGIVTNIRVCEECFDPDHPQLWVGRMSVVDNQALEFPRPDLGIADSRGTFGWNPILGQTIGFSQGYVSVIVS